MRKLIFLLLLILVFTCQEASESSDMVKLKLNEVNGYGPFQKRFGFLDWTPLKSKGIWANTEIKTTGIPTTWTKSNVAQVWFDSHQFVFQNFKQGNLSEEFFNKLMKSWKIDLNKRKLSDRPIKCFVHVAIGKNEDGELEYIVDTDNDNDFSNDDLEKPTPRGYDLDYEKLIENSKTVVAEISTNEGIIEKKIKILVLSTSNGELIYNFPQIGKTTYQGNKIIVSNGFSNLTYDDKCLIALENDNSNVVGLNEFIRIDDLLYKNLGVDINTNELKLKKIPKDSIIYSSRVGFNAKPFTVKQFKSNDSLSLDDFKSKLLYLEFWGTWCAPCIKEIPNLKNAYDNTDRAKVEFLGVAVFDTDEKLNAAIEKYDIQWPQILDQESNQLKENYNVSGYPTSFLINSDGKILAKNLRGEKLLDTLNYYINSYY